MDANIKIKEIVENPTENLSTEMKNWIDIETPEGKCKIVKGCFALRNYNGGYFIIGFNNDGTPDINNIPQDVTSRYHPDKVQALISEYASEPFEAEVYFGKRTEGLFPVIKIPSGIETPVATKKPMTGNGGKRLFDESQVFFRTLSTNNTASTASATHKDWKDIVKICFDNREADIAKFIKRHLNFDAVQSIIALIPQAHETPSKYEELSAFVAESFERLQTIINEASGNYPKEFGWLSLGFAFSQPQPNQIPTQSALNTILSCNPNLTGWPLWLDSRGFGTEESRPLVYGDCWEVFLPVSESWGNHLDYWRASGRGLFVHFRALEDDITWADKGPTPLGTFEYGVVLRRIGEAIACSLAFAEGLNMTDTEIFLTMKVTKMKGRRLSSWGTPGAMTLNRSQCHQEEYSSQYQYKADIAKSAIADIVHEVSKPLLSLFGGYEVNKKFVQDLIDKLLARQW